MEKEELKAEQAEFAEFEEDFDAKPASYQVWMLGYDADQNITDFSKLLKAFADPDAAIKFAQDYVSSNKFENETIPETVAYVEVLVETVVEVEGYEENVGTLFSETIQI